jgi:S-layer homology domain
MNTSITLSWILGIVLICLNCPAQAYTDVSQRDWSYEAINELSNKYGIVVGYPDGSFKPKKDITREEEAAALLQLMRWIETHPNSASVDDLRKMNMLMSEYQQELSQLQNEVRTLHQEQDAIKARLDQVDAKLDWNVKNRGLVHMLAMGGGKLLVGAGKDIITLGKGTVWLFTLGRVNLFERTSAPPDPADKSNRYNGPIQFVNGSAF